MPSRLSYLSLCAVLAAGLGAYAVSGIASASAQSGGAGEPQTLALPPKPTPVLPLPAPIAPAQIAPAPVAPIARAPTPVAPAPIRPAPPVATGRVSPSNPSTGIVAVNRSVPQPLGPNSPPPSSFENSCAPAPYVFQSKAGYEAVRVKDCTNDQLLYLPSSAQSQISRYVAECQRRCGQ